MIPVSARNIQFVGHTDQIGRGDGVQVMVHKGHAFVGHMFSDGFTITDVSDPRQPRPINFVAAPPNSRAFHLQTHGDLLLTVNAPNIWVLQGYSDPNDYFKASITETFTKREKTFTAGCVSSTSRSLPSLARSDSCQSMGWVCTACGMSAGAMPTPRVIGWALPTTYWQSSTWPSRRAPKSSAAGGCPACTLQAARRQAGGRRYALHHAIVSGNLAYAAWRDGGMTILDVADPTAPKLLAHRNWCPPFGGGTHTPLPLPGRNFAVFADEGNLDNCANGIQHCWVFDVREPTNPVQIAAFPTPAEEDYCKKGAKFGPHNLHENRPGSFQSEELIFATYQNAGVRKSQLTPSYLRRRGARYLSMSPLRQRHDRGHAGAEPLGHHLISGVRCLPFRPAADKKCCARRLDLPAAC
jgi:hypothetical protein